MAPINLPDGSQVSEIVLPDGSTASEVLAPDGSPVFSAIPDLILDDFEYLTDGEAIDGQENWTVSAGVAEGHDGSTNVNTFRGGSISLLFQGGSPGDIRKSITAAQWPSVSYIQGVDGGGSNPNRTTVALANSTDGLIFETAAVDTGSGEQGDFEINGQVQFSSVADGDEIDVDMSIDWDNEEFTATANGAGEGTFSFLNSTDEADVFYVWSDTTDGSDLGLLDNVEFSG